MSSNLKGVCAFMSARAIPEFSKSKVDAAGAVLIKPEASFDDLEAALTIINNWRSSHSFPLNTFHMGLRRRASAVDPEALTSERIKRLSSIRHKLERYRTRLSQVQDIGGCRATLHDIDAVIRVRQSYEKSDVRHKLDHVDDYIGSPQKSGYRGVHMIYRYESDRNKTYNGLKIEVQLRSQLQHAWATAVETVGTFSKQAYKSSQGDADWLRFFALMSSAIALRENAALVPDTPHTKTELVSEIRGLSSSLDVVSRLRAYGSTLDTLGEASLKKAHYVLLKLEPANQRLTLTGYRQSQLAEASEAYLEAEKTISEATGSEAVLVSVGSLAALRRAYPNYFLDTKTFLTILEQTIA